MELWKRRFATLIKRYLSLNFNKASWLIRYILFHMQLFSRSRTDCNTVEKIAVQQTSLASLIEQVEAPKSF